MSTHSTDTNVANGRNGRNWPLEPKVKAATLSSYLGSLLVVAGTNIAQDEDHALLLGTMPEWLESLLLPLVPALAALGAGYWAKHQLRR